jgi:hypothetical protein
VISIAARRARVPRSLSGKIRAAHQATFST